MPIDGRSQRRSRNKDAVVDGVIELAASGNLDPTSEEIASVAGISHRSIYRYFDTRSDLLDAAVIRAFETASAQVFEDQAPQGSFDDRVEWFVAARIEIYRQVRSIARVASLQIPDGSAGLEQVRGSLRARFFASFAFELDALDPEQRRLAVPVADAAFQFEALDYLCSNAGLDDESLRRSLEWHVRRHLADACG